MKPAASKFWVSRASTNPRVESLLYNCSSFLYPRTFHYEQRPISLNLSATLAKDVRKLSSYKEALTSRAASGHKIEEISHVEGPANWHYSVICVVGLWIYLGRTEVGNIADALLTIAS